MTKQEVAQQARHDLELMLSVFQKQGLISADVMKRFEQSIDSMRDYIDHYGLQDVLTELDAKGKPIPFIPSPLMSYDMKIVGEVEVNGIRHRLILEKSRK